VSVALNLIPQSPHVARVKDVEQLVRMELAVLHVRTKQVVVRAGVPLTRNERRKKTTQRTDWLGRLASDCRDS